MKTKFLFAGAIIAASLMQVAVVRAEEPQGPNYYWCYSTQGKRLIITTIFPFNPKADTLKVTHPDGRVEPMMNVVFRRFLKNAKDQDGNNYLAENGQCLSHPSEGMAEASRNKALDNLAIQQGYKVEGTHFQGQLEP